MTIIDGRLIAKQILNKQKQIIKKHQLKPKLAAILIGNDEASRIYINEKRKKSKKNGIKIELFDLPADVKQTKVIELIKKLNNDKTVSGIIAQFPLPKTLNADAIVKTIDPKKDADGFHPKNIKQFLKLNNLSNLLHKNLLLPATPAAIIEILNCTINSKSIKQIAFIGKPSVFTKPLIHYFQKISQFPNFPISQFQILSPNDPDLALKTKRADILITACGKPNFIKSQMVKPGAIVIDVGISRVDSQATGDVDFYDVAPKALAITPVPGGVGPVTVAVLLRNVVLSALTFYDI